MASWLVFVFSLVQLIAVQILLRKLGLFFPVDLTTFALVLSVQLLTLSFGTAALTFIPIKFPIEKLLAFSMALKAITIAVILFSHEHVLGAALFFFLTASLEAALLYRFFGLQQSQGRFARLNLLIYTGSAVGLLLAEKILFQRFDMGQILFVLAGVQAGAALAWHLFAQQKTDDTTLAKSAGTAKLAAGNLIIAFGAGFFLFAGLLMAYRLLRIYLRDSADITAEVTAISMFIAAVLSHYYPRLTKNAVFARTIIFGMAPAVLLLVSENLHALISVPREFFIALLLLGISAPCAFLFNQSLAASQSLRETTGILSVNGFGSFLGALVFGYFVIPRYNLELALRIFGFVLMLFCGIIMLLDFRREKSKRRLVAAGLIISLCLTIPQLLRGDWYGAQIRSLVHRVAGGESIAGIAETPQDLWVLTSAELAGVPLFHRLLHNSHSMSGTNFPNRRYMKLMAYLGYLYAEKAESALNIGYGTGLTAQALLENEKLRSLDVVDVTREIEKLTRLIHQQQKNSDPLDDHRLSYFTGGIRYFLRHSTKKYDIITGEPPPPSNSTIAYLYTKEFYRDIYAHLNPGGAFTYWLPTHAVSDRAAAQIWRTFCSEFVACDLYAGTETNLIMIGYRENSPVIDLNQKWPNLKKTKFTEETNLESLADVFSLLIQSSALELKFAESAKILTDDASFIEEGYPSPFRKPWGLPLFGAPASAELFSRTLNRHFTEYAPLKAALRSELIYSVDTALDHYLGLYALEKLMQKKASKGVILWMLGIDNRAEAIIAQGGLPADHLLALASRLAHYLARGDFAGAQKFLEKFPAKIYADERIFAYLVFLRRIQGVDQREIKAEALRYARTRNRVSAGFRNYVDQKIIF